MKHLESSVHDYSGPFTIWSKGAKDLVTHRYLRLVTIVLPITYFMLLGFGVGAMLAPLPSFVNLIGETYGIYFGALVALSSLVSLLSLIFRLKAEIYSAIVLGALLTVYWAYILFLVFNEPGNAYYLKVGVIFSIGIYPVLPAWRIFDIVLEIRKARQRQLYAANILGGDTNDGSSY